jgi:hypothetical protein
MTRAPLTHQPDGSFTLGFCWATAFNVLAILTLYGAAAWLTLGGLHG